LIDWHSKHNINTVT